MVQVQHGFPTAHDHDPAHPFSPGLEPALEEIQLSQDFRRRQVPDETVEAAGTEGAVHGAAHLGRKTDAVAIVVVHEHRFHRGSVRQLQEHLVGQPVPGFVFLQDLHLAGGNGVPLFQLLPGFLAQVAHLGKVRGRLFIQPAEHLFRPELLHAQSRQFCLEFFQGQTHDFFFAHGRSHFRFSKRQR